MDHNKRRTNKKTKRTTETRTNSNELKSEEDVEQSPANPHSLGFEIKHPYLLGK